ncbi:hypothetical protein SI65_08212 [Aspergillus cristatus]|uniref:Adenosine deaminase domain-containing protein n=1 Tax=Aspergillus cristatus TaxID=573508 RepID=A0A1E3B5I4_ASPCR|nr:hypothetical protein SI65_08212 [Aspergillus cristatus]
MRLLSILGVATLSLSASAALVEGEPDVNSTLVQQHLRDRQKLITLEKTHRQDHLFRQNLSPTAREADKIVEAIRQYEIDNYWRIPAPPQDAEEEQFAGEMFPRARDRIANTTLWQVVRRMPKGSLLHAHLSAMLPYEKVVRTILDTEGMVISASQPIDSEEARFNASITFAHVNTTLPTNETSISDSHYVPDTQVPIKQAADSFPGGVEGFLDFIKEKTTVPPEESQRHELGVDEVWRRFQACFGPADTLIQYEPVVRVFYKQLFTDLVNDGINWVEIRSGGSSGKLVHDGDEDIDPDLDVWWDVLLDEVNKFKATEKGQNFWGVRVIWSDARGKDRAKITRSMKIALERKQKFPELFSGYDLVAQEDLGRPLSDLAPELVWFREQTILLTGLVL